MLDKNTKHNLKVQIRVQFFIKFFIDISSLKFKFSKSFQIRFGGFSASLGLPQRLDNTYIQDNNFKLYGQGTSKIIGYMILLIIMNLIISIILLLLDQ